MQHLWSVPLQKQCYNWKFTQKNLTHVLELHRYLTLTMHISHRVHIIHTFRIRRWLMQIRGWNVGSFPSRMRRSSWVRRIMDRCRQTQITISGTLWYWIPMTTSFLSCILSGSSSTPMMLITQWSWDHTNTTDYNTRWTETHTDRQVKYQHLTTGSRAQYLSLSPGPTSIKAPVHRHGSSGRTTKSKPLPTYLHSKPSPLPTTTTNTTPTSIFVSTSKRIMLTPGLLV